MGEIIKFRKRRKWTSSRDYPTSRKKPSGWRRYASEWSLAAIVGTAIGVGIGTGWVWADPKIITPNSMFRSGSGLFGNCYVGGGTNCVVDGDTFYMDGAKIRIADIDAPETHPPRCSRERELGFAATRRLRELLNSGRPELSSIDRDEDVYGRKLRNVEVNGADIGDTLISEGLAHRYVRGKRPWC